MPFDLPDALNTFDLITAWMKKDLECMISGDANYSASLCLLAYCESLGRFRNGTLGQPDTATWKPGREAFGYFLRKMKYVDPEPDLLYSNLRNGMAHSYIPNRTSNFLMNTAPRGFNLTDPNSIKVHVKTAYAEFCSAIAPVRTDIQSPSVFPPISINLNARMIMTSWVTGPTSWASWINTTSGSTTPGIP